LHRCKNSRDVSFVDGHGSVKNPIGTDGIEITSRRSERLKTKPKISYYEDDSSLNKYILNAHTIFNNDPINCFRRKTQKQS